MKTIFKMLSIIINFQQDAIPFGKSKLNDITFLPIYTCLLGFDKRNYLFCVLRGEWPKLC